MRAGKKEDPHARTLRRHYKLLSMIVERIAAMEEDVQVVCSEVGELRKELHAAVERKPNRALEQLMGELRAMHADFLAIVPSLPRWTPEQRAAFQAGVDAKTDEQIRAVIGSVTW